MRTIDCFGTTAQGLAKNPLGIIALFIVLIYGFASLVVGFSDKMTAGERIPIIWFLVIFPVIVLLVFSWLVSKHHKKLYAPSDYKDEINFVRIQDSDLNNLTFAAPQFLNDTSINVDSTEEIDLEHPTGREIERNRIYAETRGVFLAHLLERSQENERDYNIFIYLVRHKIDGFADIVDTEFFFGRFWGNKIYKGTVSGNKIGVKTTAYGPFLCTCRIAFTDGEKITIHRYIDLEMGGLLSRKC